MQLPLPIPVDVPDGAYDYGERSSGETHGVVLTRPHIVEMILDLAGYNSDRNLHLLRLLEPSCGHGAFLCAAARRLINTARRIGCAPEQLLECIRAFDIDAAHVNTARRAVIAVLREGGVSATTSKELAEAWIQVADFLLTPASPKFDFVVGNPPYIRIEQVPRFLHDEYRRRYRSLFDRADLYIAFIEHGLAQLSGDGVLSFICADRWIANRYGAPLRELISAAYRLRCYIDLHTASPFDSDVIAYPSIFVIGRGTTGEVPVVSLRTGSPGECAAVPAALNEFRDASCKRSGVSVVRYKSWFQGEDPWVLSSPEHLSALRTLEARFPPLEANARVGIGVATGCDRLFIVPGDCDIEADRLVPIVMRRDINDGKIMDSRRCVINTFEDCGSTVDLERYPRLKRYLTAHGADIRKRHVSRKNPNAWFRTIDRVYPELVKQPKLLIPDIAGSNEVAFDPGRYHPHHNLYFVVSDSWDMEILGGLLSSRVALFFVWSYAVKMRGGYLRFQAQYLRRIRVPAPTEIRKSLAGQIRRAFRARDFPALDELALDAYGIPELPAFEFVDTRK